MFYEDVFRELDKEKVEYVIAGGIAVNLHGVPRVTEDLDLLICLSQKNVARFSKAMETLGYKPKVPVSIKDFGIKKNRQIWIRDKKMRVFSLWNKNIPYRIIDVFVENPIGFKKLYKDRVNISMGEFTLPVISIEQLIQLKELAGRKQDMSDIESLKRVKELRKYNGCRKKRF